MDQWSGKPKPEHLRTELEPEPRPEEELGDDAYLGAFIPEIPLDTKLEVFPPPSLPHDLASPFLFFNDFKTLVLILMCSF